MAEEAESGRSVPRVQFHSQRAHRQRDGAGHVAAVLRQQEVVQDHQRQDRLPALVW